MTPGDGATEGWDPTRPLTGDSPDRPASRGSAPETEAVAGDAAGPSPGGHADGGRQEAGDGARPPVLLPHLERLAALAARASGLEDDVARYAAWVERALRSGGKLVLCGNGGGAATAEHVAAEYVVRFERTRRPMPAMALGDSGAVVTAAANDLSFSEVFERQLHALLEPDDLLVLHSTSGESENLVRAARVAGSVGARSVALVAAGGGRLADEVDLPLVVPTDEGARAQELHLAVEHAVVDRVEASLARSEPEDGTGRRD